ncbi:LOW QUALITY PROTEIN: Hypothetical protein PHPALM_36950 [Phytophthora palmivora]|uniref:Nudix hydrolase domain-containing protein n=1 Tax=Phytophthora palmivora TaxID=4796 RepID=A0A2P4WYN3_9STRA|nr:LOW QUALITY PROTEIN: Hypothetical protein PHPALM_36950 [Phytophthora palmivora]
MSLSAKEEWSDTAARSVSHVVVTITLLDKENNVIGKADRAVMRAFNLPHRASYIVIKNSSGEYYVQRRTKIKDYCPGMLDPMTGGVVQYGESMELNAEREAEEEMGVKNTPLRYLTTFYYDDDHSRVWGGLFDCTFDDPLVLQEEEVDEVLMMTADEILARRSEFTPDGIFAFEKYLKVVQAESK